MSELDRLNWIMYYQQVGKVPAVCEKFGITRKTFYKWYKRYKESGWDIKSLATRSRRPRKLSNELPEKHYKRMIELHKQYPELGQRRLRKALLEEGISISERTIWKRIKRWEEQNVQR